MAKKPNPNYLPQYSHNTLPLSSFDHHDIHTVRITWVDLTNNTRFRVLPISSFKRLLASSRPGVTIAKCILGITGITCAPGFGPVGEYLYVVDLSSIRLCTYAPGHVSIMGWFQDKVPAPGRVLGTGVPLCPRSVLNRVLDTAKSYDVAFLVGFETEFILLRNTSPIEAVNAHGYCNSQALTSGTIETLVMNEISLGLVASGIDLMMYHSEAAPGQYEIVTGPLPPLEAADALVHTRQTIVNCARQHGLYATFAPRLILDNCGSAAHAHISVHPISPKRSTSTSTFSSVTSSSKDDLITPLERIFLAGLLAHLPAACAFTLPTRASYARMVDGIWSGGTWVAWGSDNREVPVRLCVPPAPALDEPLTSPNPNPNNNNNNKDTITPSKNHFEVKCIDGMSSPYLALSALLGAGLLGIQTDTDIQHPSSFEPKIKINKFESLVLVEQDCGSAIPSQMSESEREMMGVRRRMPRTWEEARGALVSERERALRELIGEEVVKAFLAVGEDLDKLLGSATTEAERVQMLVENY